MPTAIYAGELSANQLLTLVEKLRPQAPHTILERVDAIDFPEESEPFNPEIWSEGRIFGKPLEVRWARRGDQFHVIVTCEQGSVNSGLTEIEILGKPENHAYYLWGEGDIRIGRILEYRSIPGPGRGQLVVAEFYNAIGDLHHWRYVCFQREKPS